MYMIASSNIDRTSMTATTTATTLSDAKKICEEEFGGGYISDTLEVLEDGYEEGFVVVARRSNHPAGKWIDYV
jgi:hypothetical protein